MPRALGSNRALRITSWSPSILLQPLAANDAGCRLHGSRAIGCLAAHDREGDARHFIGERDGDKLEGLGLHEFLREGSQRVFVRFATFGPLPPSPASPAARAHALVQSNQVDDP
jgi:hypothetical protein